MRKIDAGIVLIAVLLAAFAAGCGGGGSSGSTGGSSSASTSSPELGTDGAGAEEPGAEEAAAEFGGEGIADFGKEADSGEREAASTVLEENLKARASGNWAGQCATLSASVVKTIEKGAPVIGGPSGCASQLAVEAKNVPAYILANTMGEPVAALRVKGTSAYALYHGNDGKDYAMSMEKEGGEWKVASLTTIPLSKPKPPAKPPAPDQAQHPQA